MLCHLLGKFFITWYPLCLFISFLLLTTSYQIISVIDTWAKAPQGRDGASKAMKMLKKMNALYLEEGDVSMKPTGESRNEVWGPIAIRFPHCLIIFDCLEKVYTYSACMNAFAKSAEMDAPTKAEALLKEMKKAYEAGDMDAKPNVVSWTLFASQLCKYNSFLTTKDFLSL